MGQKCSSTLLRLGLNKNWLSRWNSPCRKTTIKWILEDERIRAFCTKHFEKASLGIVEIERFLNLQNLWTISIIIHVIEGAQFNQESAMDYIKKEIRKIVGKEIEISVLVLELKNPGVNARILAKDISNGLENRMPFRSLLKRTLKRALMSGAKGIRIKVTGRINGVEMSRSESYSEGSIPLSTLRADIDYCCSTAKTTYGIIGIKVWVNRGIYFGKHFMPLPAEHKFVRNHDKNKYIGTTY